MKIDFKKVNWKNLLSYGNEVQTFTFKNGIDMISGKNGEGKSTIIEAIFYGLFGKPFRKIKNGSLLNDINKKRLEVNIYFSADKKEYRVYRGQKPNVFIIYEKIEGDFVEIPEKPTIKEYQLFLENDILKIDETIFRQLISISSNLMSSKPFMELTQKEKERLFQVVTDTSIFNYLEEKIKNRITDVKIKSKDIEYKQGIIEKTLQSESIMIEQAKKQNENFEKHHETNIANTKEDLEKAKIQIEQYSKGIEKLKEVKKSYDLLMQEKSDLNQNLTGIEFEKVQYNDNWIETYEEKFKVVIKKIDDDYDSITYDIFDKEILDLQDKLFTLKSRTKDVESIIKNIKAAKKGSIQCKKCNTTNYLIDIDEDEVNSLDDFIAEKNSLDDEYIDIEKNIKDKKEKLSKLKEENRKKYMELKKQIQEDKKNELADFRKIQDDFKKDEIETLEIEILDIQKKIYTYKEALLKSKHIKATLEEQKSLVAYYEQKLLELYSIKMVEIDEKPLNDKKQMLDEIINEKEEIINSQHNLNYLLGMLSDKGENNLKGQIIARTVPFLNKGINYFLEKFSLNYFNFIVDENFKEKIISRENNTEYNSLSNGQKMRISFSIMFSFLKLIEEKNGVSTNLLFLDEILDGSLDASGRDELLYILKDEFSDKKDIIIISHNQDIKDKVELFSRLISIKKDKFSSINIDEN